MKKYQYIKRPVYQIDNKLEWDNPEFIGDDVEFIQQNNLDMYSGIDIFKCSIQDKSSELVASLTEDVQELIDAGDGNLKLYRSSSIYVGDAKNPGYTNSIRNDDAIIKGFKYDNNIAYRIVPSPLVSSDLDIFGRRIFLSDIKTSDIKFDVKDEQAPRSVTIDSYDIKSNSDNSMYEVVINFQPLNGDGVGEISLLDKAGRVQKRRGYYEVSGSDFIDDVQQPNNWAKFKNPPRSGIDLLIANEKFDRETDIIQHTSNVVSGSVEEPIDYKITAVSYNKQKSETIQQIFLTQLKEIAPIHSQVSYLSNQTPDAVILKWALRGEGDDSNFVEVYKGMGKKDSEIKLNRLGIFESTVEEIVDPTTQVRKTVYEFVDNDIKLESETDILIVKYALRLVHPRDAEKSSGRQASKFQYYTANRIGDLTPGSRPLSLQLQKRRRKDFGDYIIPTLSATDVRKMQKNAIVTKREFKLASRKNVDRTIMLVIFEPKTGLYTEKKFNLKKIN